MKIDKELIMWREETQNILLVDDEEDVLKTLSKLLDFWNIKWEKANRGETAIRKVKQTDFDIILLDINLPDMNGIEVLKKIRGITDQTQVIMISGMSHLEHVRAALHEGAYDYLVKPWDIEDLELTMSRAIEYKQLLSKH